MRKLAQERSASVSPIRHLNDVWNELGLPAAIPATGYSDDRHVPRRLVVEAVQSSELKNLNRWTQNLGAGAFVDGYALLVVAEDTTQLEEAAKRAREIDHPQIAIGIPKEPLPKLFGDLRRHEALIYLGQTEANLYGPGADSCEEWTASCDEYHTLLQQAVEPLINGRAGRLDLVSWIWRGDEQEGITSVSRLTAFSSRVMETVFPLTPSIPHDILADEAQKDTFRKHRMPVIDLLLSQDGPAKLAAPGVKPQKHVIDALLRHNGILRSVGGRFEVARPNEEQFPAMAATWDVIAAFIERCKGAPQALDDLVTELRRPPYGLPVRCMPLIFASVARETIGRGNLVIRYQRTRTIEERITRVDGEAIETAFASPVQFRIDHVDVSVKQRVLLQGFAHGMGFAWPDEAEIGQALEELADDAKRWWIGLPGHAHLTKVLDSPALVIKRDIFEPLAHPETDAHKILLETMPDIVRVPDEVGAEIENDELHEMVARVFSDVKEEFEGAVSRATERVQTVVAEAFSAHCPSATAASDALRIWHDGLDQTKKDYKFVGDAGKLMGVAADPGPDTAAKLAESLMGRPVSGWADEVVDQFQGRLQGAKLHVEAFQLPPRDGGGDGSGEGGDGGKLPPGHARIRIVLEGETYEKVIALATQVSDNGRHLENLLRSAVTGMGSQLPDGECLTIVLQIFKDALDGY